MTDESMSAGSGKASANSVVSTSGLYCKDQDTVLLDNYCILDASTII